MPYRELLGHPLEIDPDDLPSRLTECALYPEFAERFADAFDLIDEGQYLWKKFYSSDQGWDPVASQVASRVSLMAFNIRQNFNSYPSHGLAKAIRDSRLGVDTKGVSDTQLVAALAIDRACRSIQILWAWINWIEGDARLGDLPHTAQISMAPPDIYLEMVNEHRATCPHLEIEAREPAAIYMGDARNYMTIAIAYLNPNLTEAERVGISRGAVKQDRYARSRKGILKSAEVRKGLHADRDAAICRKGEELKSRNGTERGIAGRIVGTATGAGLKEKQIRNILVAGKVLTRTKKNGK